MPWYRLKVDHGPGHQTSTERYEWSDEVLTKDGKEEMFNSLCNCMEYPIGKITLVKKLPEKVKTDQISLHKCRISYARKMLKVLKQTEVRKTKRSIMKRKEYLSTVKFKAEMRRKSNQGNIAIWMRAQKSNENLAETARKHFKYKKGSLGHILCKEVEIILKNKKII